MAISNVTNIMQNYKNIASNDTIKNQPHSPVQTLANGDKEVHGVSFSTSTQAIRAEQQASVIEHFFNDGSTATTDAMKLTFKAAIEKINEMFSLSAPEESEKLINQEKLNEEGIGFWSPENTANRIVETASFFFAAFKNANPSLDGTELIEKFNEVVGGGLKQGFEDAKGILDGVDVFAGSIQENFDKTVALVEQGMQGFGENKLEELLQSTSS